MFGSRQVVNNRIFSVICGIMEDFLPNQIPTHHIHNIVDSMARNISDEVNGVVFRLEDELSHYKARCRVLEKRGDDIQLVANENKIVQKKLEELKVAYKMATGEDMKL